MYTFHGEEDLLDFELTSITVHPDLQLNSVEMFPHFGFVSTAKHGREVVKGASHD